MIQDLGTNDRLRRWAKRIDEVRWWAFIFVGLTKVNKTHLVLVSSSTLQRRATLRSPILLMLAVGVREEDGVRGFGESSLVAARVAPSL